jgi:hypothetical protein
MKYHLFVSYRSEVSGRWLKYRFVGLFDSYRDAEYYGDMITANHLTGTVRFRIF